MSAAMSFTEYAPRQPQNSRDVAIEDRVHFVHFVIKNHPLVKKICAKAASALQLVM